MTTRFLAGGGRLTKSQSRGIKTFGDGQWVVTATRELAWPLVPQTLPSRDGDQRPHSDPQVRP